jgi:GTPase
MVGLADGRTVARHHPQQTSERLPPQLGERLHLSEGEAVWIIRTGREAERAGLAERRLAGFW